MTITEEKKTELFEQVLRFEHLAENGAVSGEMSDGAFAMLQVLGLSSEYIQWAIGK